MTLAFIATLIMLAIGACAVAAIMVIAIPDHMPTDNEGDEDDN